MKKSAESKELLEDGSNYNKNTYQKAVTTVDIIVCAIKDSKLQVLLIKRKFPPFRNLYCIVGGYLDISSKETLEEAAQRELFEETGISKCFTEQLKTYGKPSRDPRDRTITIAYYALFPYKEVMKVKAGDDASEASYFPFNKLPKLGFDHKTILKDALERIRGKILYTPIAFSLLPKKFTWNELQEVYEIVLDKKLLTSNFRRDIKRLYEIEETSSSENNGLPGKNPSLLRFKKVK